MSRSRFIQICRRVMEKSLSPLGFERLGHKFLRTTDRLLQVITLHKSNPWTFTGEFAVHPLVCPSDYVALSFGGRVDEVVPGRTSFWEIPEDADEIERVVEDFANSLVQHVVPWLDRFRTCQHVVDADVKKTWGIRRLGGPTHLKDAIIIGLCALEADLPEVARSYLELARRDYRSQRRQFFPKWFVGDLRLVEEYLELLDRENWDAIRAKLAEGEAHTRKALRLEEK